jgi:hypothetical protein
MDVRDDRHRAFAHDVPERAGRGLVGGRDADDVGARLGRRTCATVAATSVVSVLVIVWTEIGASPPTGTLPTMIWRDLRR